MASFFARTHGLAHPPNPPEYAFTEINTLEFALPVDLENEGTQVGQLWAKTIQIYFSHVGVETLWWGRRAEEPQVTKLIIDWKSSEDRTQLLSSPEFNDLETQWLSCPVPVQSSEPTLFALSSRRSSRENVFSIPENPNLYPDPIVYPGKPYVSVFLTFHFPPTLDFSVVPAINNQSPPVSKEVLWETAWYNLRNSALRSKGGLVSSGSTEGWRVGDHDGDGVLRPGYEKSFVGLFRFRDLEKAHDFFDVQNDAPGSGRNEGGLVKLRNVADGSMTVEIEFVTMVYRKTSDPPKPIPFFLAPGYDNSWLEDIRNMHKTDSNRSLAEGGPKWSGC